MKGVRVGGLALGGGGPLFFIGGPCAMENERMLVEHAGAIREITSSLGVPFVFKSSYDKANRTSGKSYRGPGIARGLKWLRTVRKRVGVPVLTDVHTVEEARQAGSVVDIVQIPAFLCRQTDLIVACAKHGRAVNIKKGQFVAPLDMKHALQKAESTGNRNILLTERGFSFGYNNLVADMRAIPMMKSMGYPVVFDAGHSVQLPSAGNGVTAGLREMIPVLARASVAAGADGIFLEVHKSPNTAPSDGPNMLPIGELEHLLRQLVSISASIR